MVLNSVMYSAWFLRCIKSMWAWNLLLLMCPTCCCVDILPTGQSSDADGTVCVRVQVTRQACEGHHYRGQQRGQQSVRMPMTQPWLRRDPRVCMYTRISSSLCVFASAMRLCYCVPLVLAKLRMSLYELHKVCISTPLLSNPNANP